MSINAPASLRSAFAVPEAIAYFNTANLSPMLHVVRQAGEEALSRRGQPWTIAEDDWFSDVERLRALVGELLGGDADGVALVPATSYGFAVAAGNLRPPSGSRVLVLDGEYPSGIYTWRRLAAERGLEILTVRREPGEEWADAVLRLLDERVSVVSVPNVHWTDGAWVDLASVAARTHDVGAALVIDASQSLGAVPFDVGELRPDFVTSVGYKWQLGPFGRGYLWAAPEHRDGSPLEENWINRAESQDFARLIDYRDEYQRGARRYDQGERTMFELTPMAIAATEQILAWGVEDIAAALAIVTGTIVERTRELGLFPSAPKHGPHLIGLTVPEAMRNNIVPALERTRCFAALRGSVLRISPHLHVTDADVDRLVDALSSAVTA